MNTVDEEMAREEIALRRQMEAEANALREKAEEEPAQLHWTQRMPVQGYIAGVVLVVICGLALWGAVRQSFSVLDLQTEIGSLEVELANMSSALTASELETSAYATANEGLRAEKEGLELALEDSQNSVEAFHVLVKAQEDEYKALEAVVVEAENERDAALAVVAQTQLENASLDKVLQATIVATTLDEGTDRQVGFFPAEIPPESSQSTTTAPERPRRGDDGTGSWTQWLMCSTPHGHCSSAGMGSGWIDSLLEN